MALETSWSGIVELTYSKVSNDQASGNPDINSYLSGDYGKFGNHQGSTSSVTQAAFNFEIDWENNYSFHLVSNAYLNGSKDEIGITESYLKYKGLPDENGIRYQGRAGIIYPRISLENIATAWASPYSLNYSMINSWVAEEVRHAGIELTVNHLGKFNKKKYDLNVSLSLFQNNDTTGALLAWHGWTQNSRQTLWQETIPLPNAQIRMVDQPLSGQADNSDPFTEIDGRTGYHINGEWRWQRKVSVLIGHYDNRTKPYIEIDGQYGWHTRFYHLGLRWKFDDGLTLISQHLSGDTHMQSPYRTDVVNNDYRSSFVMLSKQWNQHRLTVRIESFEVIDRDKTSSDDNNETGNSFSLNYAYKLNKNWFLHAEFSQIDSQRFSRTYHNQAVNLVENQWQLAARYFY